MKSGRKIKKKLMNDVENFVYEHYKQNSPPENVYHNLRHVQNVVEKVKDIGKASGVSNEDLDILIIASWFHDVGFLETSKDHENQDKDYLDGSMIKDFYFLGQVLGKKYELLKLCYTFFMYGIIISVIFFAIFTWLNQIQLN